MINCGHKDNVEFEESGTDDENDDAVSLDSDSYERFSNEELRGLKTTPIFCLSKLPLQKD